MIGHLNNLLRHLLMDRVDGINAAEQVRFQPPDDIWRTYVSNLTVDANPVNALNVYLFDLRENRKLRSNARARSYDNGMVREQPAPARLDCHYLISAWSPAAVTPSVEPTLDEHGLLYRTAAVLMNSAPLNPSRIYPEGSPLLAPDDSRALPAAIRDADLPTQILPVEGFPKLAEFWGTMGANYPWKPAVYLVVTLPVILTTEIAGPMVTTRIVEFCQTGRPGTAETWTEIGGHVFDARHPDADTRAPVPVGGAWVVLETPAGERLQRVETKADGRFTFAGLGFGAYRLRASAPGLGEMVRDIGIPSPTGEYDLELG